MRSDGPDVTEPDRTARADRPDDSPAIVASDGRSDGWSGRPSGRHDRTGRPGTAEHGVFAQSIEFCVVLLTLALAPVNALGSTSI
jgi:hypothetical protein